MIRLLSFTLLLFLPSLAPAWGRVGHQVIGQIAGEHLTPETKAVVAELLEPGETLASVSTWADEVRGQRRETGPWHYINWALEDDEPTTHPLHFEEDNVVRAVYEQLAILRDTEKPNLARQEALKYVVHFVGDLHQPLHAGTGEDRGGNTIDVFFDGASTNLHRVWDSQIIDLWGKSMEDIVADLLATATPERKKSIMQGTPYEWTVESHCYTRDVAYAHLPKAEEGVAQPDLAQGYAQQMTPLVRQRLLEGGLRLALVLNGSVAAEEAKEAVAVEAAP